MTPAAASWTTTCPPGCSRSVRLHRRWAAGGSRHLADEHRARDRFAGLPRDPGGPTAGHISPRADQSLVVLFRYPRGGISARRVGRRLGATRVSCRTRPPGVFLLCVRQPGPDRTLTMSLTEPEVGRQVTRLRRPAAIPPQG